MQPVIVSITGGTASGKSTITDILCSDNKVVALPLDWYYADLPARGFTDEERASLELGLEVDDSRAREIGMQTYGVPLNFDHPEMFEWPEYVRDLGILQRGGSIVRRAYNFTTHSYSDELDPNKVEAGAAIIVSEGLFTLDRRIQRNIGIYVNAPDNVRSQRRLQRDVRSRGRTPEQVRKQMKATVRPMFNRFVAPQQPQADVVIEWHHSTAACAQTHYQTEFGRVIEAIASSGHRIDYRQPINLPFEINQ